LVIPIRSAVGEVYGVQYIGGDGTKIIHGLKRGHFHIVGEVNSDRHIYVSEGYATAASAHEANADPVAVAFDCWNIERRYKSNDTTIEKLGEILRDNPAGLLILRDELVDLIASWDKAGHEGDRAFYLESWNGYGSFDTDRIGRGRIHIPNLCTSLFGGIQPDKLTSYLEQSANALADDGMLQRFQMLVYPDHRSWEWCDFIPNKDARDKAYAVFDAIANLDPIAWGTLAADDYIKFPHFKFNDEAQKIFIDWSTNLNLLKLPNEDNPLIVQHLAKFEKLFSALALIFHLVDCASFGSYGPIRAQSAQRAVAWCEFLEAHARRCYGLLADDGLRSAQALLDKLCKSKLSNGFTARDVR